MWKPTDLKTCRRGAEWALAVGTAQELGIFEALAKGPASASALATHLNLNPRSAQILLGILADAGLVTADEEGCRLTGTGHARFVSRDTPDFEGDAMRLWLSNIRSWAAELEETVRTGAPPGGVPRPGLAHDEEESLSRFMAAMANKEPALVEAVVAECEGRLREGGIDLAEARVLDLGGGPGVFARAFAARGARAVLADRPDVVELVSEEYDLSSVPNLELWGGDFLEELPAGEFDLILLSNISHIYNRSTNRRLIHNVGERLRPGGLVAVLDFVRGVSEFASLFAVTMLLHTEGGNTYARPDYEEWLEEAGLTGVRLVSLDADRQLVTARLAAGHA